MAYLTCLLCCITSKHMLVMLVLCAQFREQRFPTRTAMQRRAARLNISFTLATDYECIAKDTAKLQVAASTAFHHSASSSC